MKNDLDDVTMRDWFAGLVVGGLIHAFPLESWEYYAASAYALADAMIKERKVK